jgi:hypothetical protein
VIRATRRGALAGALALPAAASLAKSPKRKPSGTVLLHDPSLEAGRRFAASAEARGERVVAIEGDRIRFARAVFERAPALVIGVSRSADALLIEEVGREAGYVSVKPGSLADMLADAQILRGWVLAPNR